MPKLRLSLFCISVTLFLIVSITAFRIFTAEAAPNSPPTAVNDSYTLHGNGVVGPLLANDSDPENNPMAVVLVTTPTNGSLTGIDGNGFNYTRSNSTWTGTDSFTYKACDNQSACSGAATVTINVVNQAPVAVSDTYNVHGNTNIGPFLSNDYDPDGDNITFLIVSFPSHGTLYGLTQPDMKQYRPNWGYAGPDSFTYRVYDTFTAYSAIVT